MMVLAHDEPLTGWLPASARPVRAGVYERRTPAGRYACWDGARWRADAPTPAAAARQEASSGQGEAPWRGLARLSAAPCATCRGQTVIDRGVDTQSGADLIEECAEC